MNKNHNNLKKKNKILYLFKKTVISIKNDGIKFTIKRIFSYFKRNQMQENLNYNKIVDYFHEIEYQNTADFFSYESRKEINKVFLQDNNIKICIQIHLYHIDLIHEIIMNLNYIPFPFHCYISTDNDEKIAIIKNEFNKECKNADKVIIEKFENRGRDVAPFIEQMKKKINNYDFILHIHTKKSITCNGFRDYWRKYLYRNLLGSVENIYRIFGEFLADKNLGLIYPETFSPLLPNINWADKSQNIQQSKDDVLNYLKRIGVEMTLSEAPEFTAGNMFWARTKAVKKAFGDKIKFSDFPVETGQLDMTLAHFIERSWVYLAQYEKYKTKKIFNINLVEEPISKFDKLSRIELNHDLGITPDSIIYNKGFILFFDAWAIDYISKRTYTRIYMKVNNKLYLTEDHLSSPDIAEYFMNTRYNNVKFSFSFPVSEMNIGKNSFSALVILNDGATYYESEKIILNKDDNGGVSLVD